MDVETSEVFWDQSRVGYPRIITQKCSNRHGHGWFLTIEEFVGRRQCGTILIPEGHHSQGWTRLISKLRQVNASLWEGREVKESKAAKTV